MHEKGVFLDESKLYKKLEKCNLLPSTRLSLAGRCFLDRGDRRQQERKQEEQPRPKHLQATPFSSMCYFSPVLKRGLQEESGMIWVLVDALALSPLYHREILISHLSFLVGSTPSFIFPCL